MKKVRLHLRREREARKDEQRETKKSREEVVKNRTNRCKGPGLSHSCSDTGKKKYHGDGKTGEGGERGQSLEGRPWT